MTRHVFALTAVLLALGCSDEKSPSSGPATPEVKTGGTLRGSVTLFGKADASGTSVMIGGLEKARAATDGSYAIENLAPGLYELSFRNGTYEERVPGVLFLPEAGAFVGSSDGLTPLPTVELQNARRVYAGSGLAYNAADALAVNASGDRVAFVGDYSSVAGSGRLQLVELETGEVVRIADGARDLLKHLSNGVVTFSVAGALWGWYFGPALYNPMPRLLVPSGVQYFFAPLLTTTSTGLVYSSVSENGAQDLVESNWAQFSTTRWSDLGIARMTTTGLFIEHTDGLSFRPFSPVNSNAALVDSDAEDFVASTIDGSTVAYTAGANVEVRRMGMGAGGTVVVASPGTHYFNSWRLTDTGSHLFFHQANRARMRDTAAANPAIDLGLDANSTLVGTTPDGKIGVVAGKRVSDSQYAAYAVALDAPLNATTSLRLLAEGIDGVIAYAKLTPDGRHLLYFAPSDGQDQSLLSVPVAGGAPVLLSPGAKSFQLTPDGSTLVANLHWTTDDPNMLHVVPSAGGDRWELPNASYAQLSPDGSKLLVFELEGELNHLVQRYSVRSCRLATRECTPLAGQVRSAAWKSFSTVALMRQSADPADSFQDGIYLADLDPYLVDLSFEDGTATFSFGADGDESRRFQEFTVAGDPASPKTITGIEVQIRRFEGAVGQADVMVDLYAVVAGLPSGAPLATARIPAGNVDADCSVEVAPLFATITPGPGYAIVLRQEAQASAHYEWCVKAPGLWPFGKFTGTSWVAESNLGSGWLKVHLGD